MCFEQDFPVFSGNDTSHPKQRRVVVVLAARQVSHSRAGRDSFGSGFHAAALFALLEIHWHGPTSALYYNQGVPLEVP